MLGTIASFSPWMMRVGQVMDGRSSMQMLPVQGRGCQIDSYVLFSTMCLTLRSSSKNKLRKPRGSHVWSGCFRLKSLICVMNLEQRDLSTLWSFREVWNAVHPGLPHLREGFRSIHLLHGLPHPRTPVGDVTDRYSSQQRTHYARWLQSEKKQRCLFIVIWLQSPL